jgi:hypothetical protein
VVHKAIIWQSGIFRRRATLKGQRAKILFGWLKSHTHLPVAGNGSGSKLGNLTRF